MSENSRGFGVVFGVLLLGLAGLEICYSGAVAYFESETPALALRLKPQDAPALIHQAETDLFFAPTANEQAANAGADPAAQPAAKADPSANAAQSPAIDMAAVGAKLKQALLNEPLNPHALGLFGQVQTGDAARPVMAAAVQQSKHEVLASLWMAQYSLAQNDADKALEQFDIALRSKPQLTPQVAPFLTALAENPRSNEQLKNLLLRNPPWLNRLLEEIPRNSRDVRTPLEIYSLLEGQNIPVSQNIRNAYFTYLFSKKFYDLAYVAWLQLLNPDQLTQVKYLYNSDFSMPISHALFDWNGTDGVDSVVNTGNSDGDKTTLDIKFGSEQGARMSVFEYFKVPAGKFALHGEIFSDTTQFGLMQWRVRCFPDATKIAGQSEALGGAMPQWKPFQFEFTIPEKGCGLAIMEMVPDRHAGSGSFSSGLVRFRNFEVKSASAQP